MRILGIETSCDETGAAVIEANLGDKQVKLLSNVIASSLALHAKTGGIIPEVAAREQLKYIIPVIEQALQLSVLGSRLSDISHSVVGSSVKPTDRKQAKRKLKTENGKPITEYPIDAIAVTVGPGLIGSLLVGIETAKTLAYAWKKPIIPVNHLVGHIYANFIGKSEERRAKSEKRKAEIEFPALSLIVSGGHTDLVLMKNHQQLTWIGGTRDDAAGEAFDKIGRLLGLPYPGGPAIAAASERAPHRDGTGFTFPRPMIDSNDFDFSFSGLKTAVLREVKTMKQLNNRTIADLSTSVQQAIVDVLVVKTIKAAHTLKAKSILLGGGVAANDLLRKELEVSSQKLAVKLFIPPKHVCTDNAAMIASAAFFNSKPLSWQKITANSNLHF